MKYEMHGPFGTEGFIMDEYDEEELRRIAKIIATTEPGNGSGRIFYRKTEKEEKE